MPSHGIAGLVPPLEEPLTLLLLLLDYPDLSHTIKPCPAFDPSLHLSPEIFDSIAQLYNLSAFENILALHDLTQAYPFLVQNLHHGFPLGVFPKIHRTVIYKSLPFDSDSVAAITVYLDKELLAGRMSGPFTRVEVEHILCSPFVCSSFIVSSQFQGLGIPDKLRVCQNLSKASSNFLSVNSFILKEHFPTYIDMAFCVADIVSAFSSLHLLLMWQVPVRCSYWAGFCSFCQKARFLFILPVGKVLFVPPISEVLFIPPVGEVLFVLPEGKILFILPVGKILFFLPWGKFLFCLFCWWNPAPFVLIHLLVLCMSSSVLVVQVASAPPGTQVCSFDIKTFHHTCPVTPHHKP